MSIFPSNYISTEQEEANSPYFKFTKLPDGGSTTLRLYGTFNSGHALCGYSYFTMDKKPRRFPTFPKDYLEDIGLTYEAQKNGGDERAKPDFFLSWVCLRREADNFQIVDISQRKIREQIEATLDMEDYDIEDGEPANFFITVKRSGTGKDTSYTTIPTLKPASADELERWHQARSGIWLPALYEGGDPFAGRPSEGGSRSRIPLTSRDELGADREVMAASAEVCPSF